MNRPFFSMIIPCYNTGDKIKRLFDSLVRQNISKEDLEIIIVDDNSTDLSYKDAIKNYDFNVIFSKTDTNVHCPGNTRREGMKYVSGEWLCFCDHDDYYEDNALANVKSFIEKLNHKSYVVSTIMNGYDEEKNEYGIEFTHKLAWLHGKFYSVDNLIKPFNINFKEDLITHEDIYFNSCCLSVIFQLKTDWDYLDIPTYRWIDDKSSITRRDRNDRGYLYENFNDYLVSASEPFWKMAVETKEFIYVNQIMMTLLHAYFYYEAGSYYAGSKEYKDVLNDISIYIHRVIREFNITTDDIINFIYADPIKYEKVLEDCCIYVGKFIPKTSLRDFIYISGVPVSL